MFTFGAPPGLRVVAWFLVALAAGWLGYQFWRLTLQPGPLGAVDLRLRQLEVVEWFAGRPVYGALPNAVYPPASYLLLWPILGWPGPALARWIWALITLLALFPLCSLLTRHGGARPGDWRGLPALLALSSYPVGATIGNGQLGILVLLCLLAGLPLVFERDRSWLRDFVLATLFLLALVKPTLSAPFFWILVFAAGSLRPALLVGAGYAVSSCVASLFQNRNPLDLMRAWLERGLAGSSFGARHGEGSIRTVTGEAGAQMLQIKSVNLHSVLSFIGQKELLLPASLLVLALLGSWIFWNRKAGSAWVLIGVTALVTHFSFYHGWYDDLLLLLPLLALLRIRRGREPAPRLRTASGLLFVALSLSLLAPGGTYLLPHPWANVYVVAQALLWLLVLGFLVSLVRRPEPARPAVRT